MKYQKTIILASSITLSVALVAGFVLHETGVWNTGPTGGTALFADQKSAATKPMKADSKKTVNAPENAVVEEGAVIAAPEATPDVPRGEDPASPHTGNRAPSSGSTWKPVPGPIPAPAPRPAPVVAPVPTPPPPPAPQMTSAQAVAAVAAQHGTSAPLDNCVALNYGTWSGAVNPPYAWMGRTTELGGKLGWKAWAEGNTGFVQYFACF